LTDSQWEQIKDLLPDSPGHVGAPAKNNRLFVDAALFCYHAGIAWRDLPERFGDFRVVHLRHMRRSHSGVWLKVFTALSAQADNEYAMIDSTIVCAHQHSAGAKGALQKCHRAQPRWIEHQDPATVDALGNPTRLHITGGQVSDRASADVLRASTPAAVVIADKGYDTQERVVDPLLQHGKQAVIPSRRHGKEKRPYDKHLSRYVISSRTSLHA